MTVEIERGTIVQLNPTIDEQWGACLLIVDELKSWGVQGYIQTPDGKIYYRAPTGSYSVVGKARWVADV